MPEIGSGKTGITAPSVNGNGKPMADDELRAAELAILDGVPPPVNPILASFLRSEDPTLGPALDKLTCWGRCTEAEPCPNCLDRRRYLTLLLHRKKHGRAVHPSDRAGYDGGESIPLPDPKPGAPEKIDALELPEKVDAMDLLTADDVEPLESLPLLGEDGYFGKGLSNLLSASPKEGKTSLIRACVPSWLEMGETILYFTEEPKAVWKDRLATKPPFITQRGLNLVFAVGWEVRSLLALVKQGSETVVVIDTLRGLGILPEDENGVGQMAKAVEPWVMACRERNKTLIGLVHDRKSGGSRGRNVSGAHSLVGAVDVILQLRAGAKDNQRIVSALSRLTKPPELTYEQMDDGTMQVVDDSLAASLKRGAAGEKKDLLALLPSAQPGWTAADLVREGRVAMDTALRALEQGIRAGRAVVSGSGKKGDPKRYHRL